ncbi:MAG: glycosyltransferase family 2 protein [Planctomycetota bacterium]|nr:MAG: glycosyltransferase family 2 protein [Planctomycetota bacterium]
MDVSIVIVSWNTCDILRDCLESVYLETKGVQSEVIVIDNGSSDGSAEMIKKEFSAVNLIVNEENRGFAAANNQGMAIAQGRYVLLLNSDTIVLNNVISKTISFADNHPEAAVVGCRVMNPDKSLQPTCFMFPSILNMLLSASYLYKLFPKSKFFGREQMTWWDRSDIREVDVVTGCFMLVRQEAIKQVGTMDEQFFMYADETDWCYRFRQAGWKVLFTPDAEIIHLGGASSKSLRAEMILQTRASILLFFQKHRSTFSYRLACLAFSMHALIRIPYWLLRAIFEVKNRESHWIRVKTYTSGILKPLGGWRKLCHPSRQL